MALINLVGCNAVGKTTACERWLARYRTLQVAEMDTQWIINAEGRVRCKETKGTNEEKKVLTEAWERSDNIFVAASVRNSHLLYVSKACPIIIVTCDWQLFEHHMKTRCANRGKRYRDDYWTELRLKYECGRRYVNYAKKALTGYDVKFFEIKDQAEDWPAVDEYFGLLFRTMVNRLLRQHYDRRRGS